MTGRIATAAACILAALSASLAVTATAFALAPVGPDVVGLWQGEGDATDPFHAHDGTLLGGATFAPAASGQAFSFDGEEQAADIPDAPDLYPLGSFTIAAWVRTTDATDVQALMSHYECGLFCPGSLANSFFGVFVEPGKVTAELRDTDASGPVSEDGGQLLSAPTPLADGANHYVAMQRDTGSGELRIYVDGTLAAAAPLNAGSDGPLENLDGEADDLYIGALRRCGGGGECDGRLVYGVHGEEDDAIYWERVVTAPEIAAIYAAGPNALTTDTTAPTSLAAGPVHAEPGPITLSFTAADAAGPEPRVHDPSGLAQVDLYAKAPGEGSFSKVASAPASASGTFAYKTAAAGAYSFFTVATDAAGNVEAQPPSPDVTVSVGAPTPPPAVKPPEAPKAARVTRVEQVIAGLPSTKRCVSKRAFTIHVVVPAGVKILSATVLVNGHSVAVRKGAKLSAPVSLRGLPKGRYAVRIVVKLADGRTLGETRRYHTCIAKIVPRHRGHGLR